MTESGAKNCNYSQFACIGAGFSGIGLGATLKRWYQIDDVRFFERQSEPGGTWWANQYPGRTHAHLFGNVAKPSTGTLTRKCF